MIFLCGRIIRQLECGRTQLEVSEELGIARSVISRLWQRFQDDGNVSRCYSTGRPRVTTPNEDRYLTVTAKRNRWSIASALFSHWFSLQSDSRRTFAWRLPVTTKRASLNDTISMVQDCSFGEWGIILGSRTDLHAQIGILAGQIYRDVILE
ncbi:cubilin [Trichonephila clavipes]|nr:cubilin [Trichonephila clavipes]